MKFKKIRGTNRHLRAIENWVSINKDLDLHSLTKYGRAYVKFRVDPWSRISFTNSEFPEPEGVFKTKMLEGLLEIYDNWKLQLSDFREKYYLKIWIFKNRIRDSQVVCAIGEEIERYENLFEEIVQSKDIGTSLKLTNEENILIQKYDWEEFIDNDYFPDNYLGEPDEYYDLKSFEADKKFFENIKNTAKRIEQLEEKIDDASLYYVVENDRVWVGEKGNSFQEIVAKFRNQSAEISLAEITNEVESVREERYKRKIILEQSH